MTLNGNGGVGMYMPVAPALNKGGNQNGIPYGRPSCYPTGP